MSEAWKCSECGSQSASFTKGTGPEPVKGCSCGCPRWFHADEYTGKCQRQDCGCKLYVEVVRPRNGQQEVCGKKCQRLRKTRIQRCERYALRHGLIPIELMRPGGMFEPPGRKAMPAKEAKRTRRAAR